MNIIDLSVSALVTALMAAGLYILLTSALGLPSYRSAQMAARLSGEERSFDALFIDPAARKIVKLIKLSTYRKKLLARELSNAGMNMTPEMYVSRAVTKGLYILLPGVVAFLVLTAAGCVMLLAAVYIVFLELRSVRKRVKAHHEAVENEIPKLASYVAESITYNSDLYYILKNYRDVAGKEMTKELDLLLADMVTGNREVALVRFEGRLNSTNASSLVRGLIGIDRGEEMKSYLEGLEVQLRDWEINRLRVEVDKRPDELVVGNFALFASMAAFYMILFGTTIAQYGSALFSY